MARRGHRHGRDVLHGLALLRCNLYDHVALFACGVFPSGCGLSRHERTQRRRDLAEVHTHLVRGIAIELDAPLGARVADRGFEVRESRRSGQRAESQRRQALQLRGLWPAQLHLEWRLRATDPLRHEHLRLHAEHRRHALARHRHQLLLRSRAAVRRRQPDIHLRVRDASSGAGADRRERIRDARLAAQQPIYMKRLLQGVRQAGALRCLVLHHELRLVGVGREAAADEREEHHRGHEARGGDADRRLAMLQRPRDDAAISAS